MNDMGAAPYCYPAPDGRKALTWNELVEGQAIALMMRLPLGHQIVAVTCRQGRVVSTHAADRDFVTVQWEGHPSVNKVFPDMYGFSPIRIAEGEVRHGILFIVAR